MNKKTETYLINDNGLEREMTNDEIVTLKALRAEYVENENQIKAKQDARESAIKKLGEIAGLTKEELASIL
jgi:hypothetical protein